MSATMIKCPLDPGICSRKLHRNCSKKRGYFLVQGKKRSSSIGREVDLKFLEAVHLAFGGDDLQEGPMGIPAEF